MTSNGRNTIIVYLSQYAVKSVPRNEPVVWPRRTDVIAYVATLMIEPFSDYMLDTGMVPTPSRFCEDVRQAEGWTNYTDPRRQRVLRTYAACCNGVNVAAMCIQTGLVIKCEWAKMHDASGKADVIVTRTDGVQVSVGLAMDTDYGHSCHEDKMRRAEEDGREPPDVMLWLDINRPKEGGMRWYNIDDIAPIFTF